MKNEVKGKALVDFEKIIKDVESSVADDAYDKGKNDGKEESDQEFESEQEKRNTEYAASQFADCVTLPDFQDKLKEITNRYYNFMTQWLATA